MRDVRRAEAIIVVKLVMEGSVEGATKVVQCASMHGGAEGVSLSPSGGCTGIGSGGVTE